MAESQLIQFRLKAEARQALEALRLPGESLNLCAQRLLMGALNVESNVDRVDRTVDTVDNAVDKETLIEHLLPELTKQVKAQIESNLGELVNVLIDANLSAAVEDCLGKDQAR